MSTTATDDARIVRIDLACGMPLIVERMSGVSSAALAWLLPAGSATFDDAQDGHATLLSELILRGAGALDARDHSDALDRLGVQRSTLVAAHHLQIHATMLGSRVADALPLITSMVTSPMLPAGALEPARSLALQSLDGLEDEPQQLVMLRLRERHAPKPFHRHGHGSRPVLESATLDDLRAGWERRARPKGSILAAAGAVDPEALAAQLDRLLAGFSGAAPTTERLADPDRGVWNIDDQTAQTHIGLAWDAPPEGQPGSMLARLAARVLGGGSSSRLFTEVRERRGLVYSVGASYAAGRDTGMVTVYAGSTPERAQTTVDVIVEQVRALRGENADRVTEDELKRAIVGLRSGLVLSGESTSARATALAADYFRLGRARSLTELDEEVRAVDLDAMRGWIASHDPGEPTLVTIGPSPVQLPSASAPA